MTLKVPFSLISNFLKKYSKEKFFIAILGPTASGKTDLSLKIAKKFKGEIISADSRQVYRYLNIGTDKIPLKKRNGIPHHLLDIVNPDERFTVADFKKMAEEKIDEILSRGKIPIVVGGTGLYIRALAENFQIPETGNNLSFRKKLEKEITKILYRKLQKVDSGSAKKIHPRNRRYILRALEIFYLTGKPKTDTISRPKYHVLKIGLTVSQEILDQRIHRRVEAQFKRGLIKEVQSLLKKGYDEKLPSLQTFGYRELIPALCGKMTLEEIEEAKTLIKIHTRQFSRRQIIWFKKEKDVYWFPSPASGI